MSNQQDVQPDFPIDWEEDHYVSRREFFKFLTLAGGGLAAGTVAMAALGSRPRSQIAFDPKVVAGVSALAVGHSMSFSFPRDHDMCLLIRRAENEFVAFKQRCTHLSCPVEWQPERDRLYCPCHNGAFDVHTGAVLQGPPPRPLPQVILERRGDEIWAVGVKGGEEV
jgi:Rieske Fe-S protein